MTNNYKRVDDNQKEIVKALRQIPGCTVQSLAACGKGVPDLLVGWQGENILMEIKNCKRPSAKLTSDQVKWHKAWTGGVYVVKCFEDAIEVMNNG